MQYDKTALGHNLESNTALDFEALSPCAIFLYCIAATFQLIWISMAFTKHFSALILPHKVLYILTQCLKENTTIQQSDE